MELLSTILPAFTTAPETHSNKSPVVPSASKPKLNAKDVAKAQAFLTFSYPNLWKDSDRETQTVMMWETLKDLSPTELAVGVNKFCRVHKNIYPGTNICAYIREYGLGLDELPTAANGWEAVREQVRKEGYCGKPVFKHAIVASAVASLGWKEICDSTNPEATRAHFFKIFNEHVETYKRKAMMGAA